MSALTNQQVQGAPTASQGHPVDRGGNSLTQISAGPAALAQKLIYEIMALYAEITGLDMRQKNDMIKAQAEEAKGQAAAQIAGGKAIFEAALFAGITSIVSVVASAAVSIVVPVKAYKNSNAPELEGELGNMSEVEKAMKAPASDASVGTGDNNNNAVKDEEVKQDSPLMKQFKEGNYENAKENTEATVKATKDMKTTGQLGKEFDYQTWKEDFNSAQGRKLSAYESETRKYMTKSQIAQTIAQGVQTTGQSVSQGMSAYGQSKKAVHDAQATLDSTSAQMSGSSSGEWGQAMSKAYDAQNAEVQILERMHQTNSVNG